MRCLILILAVLSMWISMTASHEATLCIHLCPPCFPARVALCPPEPNCTHKVEWPSCSCCMMCALEEGHRCGVSRPQCRKGLQCEGRNGQRKLLAIMTTQGVCKPVAANVHTTAQLLESDEATRIRSNSPRRRRHPHHGLLAPLNHRGPCSRHLENMLTSCRFLPQVAWVPSCNRHGYYHPKQCQTSYGAEQGKCWCVNRNGNPERNSPFHVGTFNCTR